VIVSAESLFGVSFFEESLGVSQSGMQGEASISGPSLHLFEGADAQDPFSQARVGVDGVIGPGVTLGASVGYSVIHRTLRATANAGGQGLSMDEELGSTSSFVIVPRIGFVLALNSYLGVWLRGGVGYTSLAQTQPSLPETEITGVDLVLDPVLIVTPVPHAGILIGPSLNIGLSGTATGITSEAEVTNKFSSYGVNAGIALLF
jgi:hypothetical protein